MKEVTKLVEDLLDVIKYLTDAGAAPPFHGRFVSIPEDKDVSAMVDPVISRAEEYLLKIADDKEY